jgi:hypothetical protein
MPFLSYIKTSNASEASKPK